MLQTQIPKKLELILNWLKRTVRVERRILPSGSNGPVIAHSDKVVLTLLTRLTLAIPLLLQDK